MLAEIYLEEGTLPQAAFMSLGHALTQAGFPDVEFGQVESIKLTPLPQLSEHQAVPRVRMWNTDRNKLIQYSPDEFYINLIGPYLGWTAFSDLRATAEKAVRDAVGKALQFRQVALIALDAITVSTDGFQLGRYLNCGGQFIPKWYQSTTEAADISLGHGMIDANRFNQAFQISVRPQATEVTIEMQSSFRTAISMDRSLTEILESLHEESIKTFEEMITDTTRNEVMGGQR